MAELLPGIPAAPGIAIGNAVLWRDLAPIPLGRPVSTPQAELARLGSALQETTRQLRSLMDRVASKIGEKESQIVQAQLWMLGDPMLIGQVKDRIRSAGLPAEKFLALRDGYLKERAADIQDVGRRLLTNLTHSHSEEDARRDQAIIVAHDLTPSEVCLLDPERVLGIVTEAGGQTSHNAILARALNIAMVAGVKGLLDQVQDGDPVMGRDGGQHWRPLGSRRGPGGWSRKRRGAADRVPVPESRDAALRARAV